MNTVKSSDIKSVPKPTIPINDGRLPQDLFEIIQIPPDENPFKYENLWETELCDFFEDCNEFSFAHCCYYCYIYKIFKAMDENMCSYLLTPNPLIPIRTKIRAVLRIKVNFKFGKTIK
ncbi:unnamed protein product [Brachionus calyciflorus]|uniref:Uncharacterized protein n=1 Tax=Brachionus calyciflorus TaxID=104777 RepID=A0A814FK50_9BILA|nr:unnamed protein product [Brachionus calyciflorus]